MSQSMLIFSRCHSLQAWLIPKSEKFPRIYRNTVTQRLMNAVLDLGEWLHQAQCHRARARYRALLHADTALNNLRHYLGLIHHWQWISTKQYGHVSQMVEEIGRLLGGWIKQHKTSLSGQPGR